MQELPPGGTDLTGLGRDTAMNGLRGCVAPGRDDGSGG